jgi:hypothetical protein
MKENYKQSLAIEEITECIGTYNFSVLVKEDKEILSLLKNPFIIALKCTIKQDNRVLGIGRANSVLSPKNKFIKSAVLYCWSASVIDGISKAVKTLSVLPAKTTQKEDPDLEGRDEPAYFTDNDNLKYASEAQRKFLSKLISSKCKDGSKKEYEEKLKSPYLSSFQCSSLIKNLLAK